MEKINVNENAYYQDQYENNGYLITSLPYAYLIWKNGDVVKTVKTLEEAENITNNGTGYQNK